MLTSFSSSPPRPPPSPVRNFIHRILSYDSNIMLAAIISLLLVILFVLLLHIYAKWFLVPRYRRSRSSVAHVPHVLGARFHLDTNTYTPNSSPVKGISRSLISTIPSFVYRGVNDQQEKGLECTICLSLFEDEEICRKLRSCKHAFHVDCIDMWLYSHSTCPICRAPIVHDLIKKTVELENEDRRSTSSLGDTQQETISTVEIIVEVPILGRVDNENILNVDDPLSVCSSSSSCSSLTSSLSGSLKRMLSRNSSERRKVPPSTTIN